MTLTLHEVQNTKALSKFIRFPLKLYKDHPYYVPSLFPDEMNTLHWEKNPAFEYCETRYWLAYDDKRIVGRVAAIINHKHIEKMEPALYPLRLAGFHRRQPWSRSFSWGAVEAWAREKGLEAAHGPLGFTDLDREGLLIEGFTELATLATIYNYPYYQKHLERLGVRQGHRLDRIRAGCTGADG